MIVGMVTIVTNTALETIGVTSMTIVMTAGLNTVAQGVSVNVNRGVNVSGSQGVSVIGSGSVIGNGNESGSVIGNGNESDRLNQRKR